MTRMDCSEVRDLLQAFDDDELSAAERSAVTMHLQSCGECAAALSGLRSLSRRIRASGTFALPAGLDGRLRTAIGVERRGREARDWRGWVAVAASHVAVAALGALLAIATLSRSDERAVAVRDVVGAHVRAMLTDQLVQVASADTHTVRPWFAGKVPFAPDVVDLAGKGFPLLGGRVDYVLDRPAAATVYGRRKHRINVFVLPESQVPGTGEYRAVREGYNVIAWRHGGFAYFAASDLNADELGELAQALRGASVR